MGDQEPDQATQQASDQGADEVTEQASDQEPPVPEPPAEQAAEQASDEPGEQDAEIVYDKASQLEQIQSGLLPDEQVVAVYDAIGAGTGFIGLTNRRVIIQDRSFVGEKIALTSIPYTRITSISVLSNKSWAGSFFSSGSILISVGTKTYEVDFRGSHKSHHVHNLILYYIGH
jgi:Bacterial PH domain